MYFKNILVQLFIVCLLFGCVSTNSLSNNEALRAKKTYQQIALKKFGEKVEYKLNPDKRYALCEKIIPAPVLNPNQLTEFFVYDIQQDKIIYEDKIANVKISWYSNTQLLISKQKGYTTHPTDTGKASYIFDLHLKNMMTPNQTK